MTDLLIAGYLGGVHFALLMATFTARSGLTVHWRFILPLTMLWPIALPLFVVFPRGKPWRFRA